MTDRSTDDHFELAKSYDAKEIDPKWYDFQHEFFKTNTDPSSKSPPYCIVMPPPNVTGSLHMGHALVNTLQDILIRWKRMCGYDVFWVPGTDHAGIATQTIVERHLLKTMGKRRGDFSREEFLSHVWKWKEEKEGNILNQLKRLGSSCDWSKLRFTMDDGNNAAVRTMFKKMFDDGLIYKGDYLVNWDPVTETALGDEEVEYEEKPSFLWFFKYPLKDAAGFVHVATTRPETMLGDTAIAVSPNDARYKHLIGKTVILPLMEREIPIIADHRVDPEFGTGMVKVTPAHDPNDYQMGLTHNLPFINIMTSNGMINENGGKFQGLTMEKAREAVVEEMKTLGFLEKTENHLHRVGVSYRSKAVIEPYMSKQWFIKMKDFGISLRNLIVQDKTKIIPKNWENTYFHWIDSLRDWCISRQLWWGHRIPIWYKKDDPTVMICHDGEGEPIEVQKNPSEWVQDPDVLDTWFSSALWPFSTLGWPKKTDALEKFYPNAVLVTGHDILFFWVARMLLMGEYAMGETPFPEVFLHGLIYGKSYWRKNLAGGIAYLNDAERKEYELGKPLPKDVYCKWEKMSKSKGNIIDPIEIIEDYGLDAMRMALCASATQAREIDLDRRRFEEFKNFTNKIWNGARFVFMNLDGDDPLSAEEFAKGIDESVLSLEDHWILSKLNHVIQSVTIKLSHYLFDQAAAESYDFFWKEFCAYYLEIVKPKLFGKAGDKRHRKNTQKILAIILCQTMRLLHPMAPFITEELFQLLKKRLPSERLSKENTASCDPYTKEAIEALKVKACIVAPYPKVIRDSDINLEIEKRFELIEKAVYTIRNIRGEMKLPPNASIDLYFVGQQTDPDFQIVANHLHMIAALIKTSSIQAVTNAPAIGLHSTGMLNALRIIIPLPAELLEQEKVRLIKEKDKLMTSLEKMRSQLNNKEFIDNAPQELVQKHKTKLIQSEQELEDICRKLV